MPSGSAAPCSIQNGAGGFAGWWSTKQNLLKKPYWSCFAKHMHPLEFAGTRHQCDLDFGKLRVRHSYQSASWSLFRLSPLSFERCLSANDPCCPIGLSIHYNKHKRYQFCLSVDHLSPEHINVCESWVKAVREMCLLAHQSISLQLNGTSRSID